MTVLDFKAIPSDVSISDERVNQLSARSTETATALSRKIATLQATVTDARQKYSREADQLIADAAREDRSAARTFAKKAAANKASNLHRELIANSEADRAAMLKGLKNNADEAAAIQAVCMTPAMVLGRIALGESKRTQYQSQLEGAGPVELETAARQAIMSGDMVLAAAIATVVDRRPKDRRPFTVNEFAERVMGPAWQVMNTKLDGVQLAYKTAVAADREFVRGKADSLTNLSLALSRQAINQASSEEV